MLASMSEIDPRADTPLVDWSELSVSGLLPTGTVTLLLADVEGSTRLWETQPDEMTAALARLNQVVSDTIATHDGVRPVEQGEGDSFVAAFARASDAVAGALGDAARSRWRRSGCGSACIPARSSCATKATTPARRSTAPRDCAISATAAKPCYRAQPKRWCSTRLPDDAWLTDLGTHSLRDLPRPERVIQLCHPDLVNEFPPLRVSESYSFSASSDAADEFRGPRRTTDSGARAAEPRTGW